MFEPVKNQRVSDEILQQIREAVLTGKFQIGDRLPNERTLAEQFAASRTSVREALRGLEQQGVIYTKKGVTGGAFVAYLYHRLVSCSVQSLLTIRNLSCNNIAVVAAYCGRGAPAGPTSKRQGTQRKIEIRSNSGPSS